MMLCEAKPDQPRPASIPACHMPPFDAKPLLAPRPALPPQTQTPTPTQPQARAEPQARAQPPSELDLKSQAQQRAPGPDHAASGKASAAAAAAAAMPPPAPRAGTTRPPGLAGFGGATAAGVGAAVNAAGLARDAAAALVAALDPSRFVFSGPDARSTADLPPSRASATGDAGSRGSRSRSADSGFAMGDDSGSDRDTGPPSPSPSPSLGPSPQHARAAPAETAGPGGLTAAGGPTAVKPGGGSSVGAGGPWPGLGAGPGSGAGEEADEAKRALARVTQGVERLKQFVAELPSKVSALDAQIASLEARKASVVTREDLPVLQRIEAVQNYLRAVKSVIESRVEEKLLRDRIQQMDEYFQHIPPTEKTERSKIESYNAMFNVHAIVPHTLAKDHCDYCKKPLILIRKQAQLQCIFCARMTEHLMPIAHASAWMKTNVNTQPENKRMKAVLAKLNQFLVGSPPIPPDIVLGAQHALKSRFHISSESIALPTPVAAALTAGGHEKYVAYAAKVATMVNGHPLVELTPEQINEIISRLRVAQFAHNILASSGKLVSKHFYTNYAVNQILLVMGLPSLPAAFPIQRTKRLLREQSLWWKLLLHYLKQIDTSHRWP
jgi:hypothetical protein